MNIKKNLVNKILKIKMNLKMMRVIYKTYNKLIILNKNKVKIQFIIKIKIQKIIDKSKKLIIMIKMKIKTIFKKIIPNIMMMPH